MGPLIWAGAALISFLAAACTRDHEGTETSSPPGGVPSDAGSSSASPTDATAKKPSPEPLFISLGKENENPQVIRFYTRMNDQGVTDQDFDVGCVEKEKISGQGDKTVETCEVYQYPLHHHDRFYDLAKESARGDLPWSLDDHNPTTVFDEEIRKKVRQAVLLLEHCDATKGLDKNSEEYQAKLAVGLFYFVHTTNNPELLKWKAAELKIQMRELREIGLGDFQTALLNMGGLGLSDLPKTPPHQITTSALQALKDKNRAKTDFTAAHILFGVFEMAGLHPGFYSVPMKFSDPHRNEEIINGHVLFRRSRRIVVGIPLEKKTRYFNLLTLDSDGEYPKKGSPDDVFQLGLGRFLSYSLGGRAQEALLDGKNTDAAIEDLNQALFLHPSQAALWNFLGQAYFKKKNYQEAEKSLLVAVETDLKLGEAHFHLGELHFAQGKWQEGIKAYAKAVEVDADQILNRYGAKMLPRVSTVLFDNPHQPDALKILEKMTARGPLPYLDESY